MARISGNRSRRWRRQQQPPAWPTDQTDRPTWAVEQQQILPAVDPPVYVVKECGDLR